MHKIKMYQKCTMNCNRNFESVIEDHDFLSLSLMTEKHHAFVTNGDDGELINRICPGCSGLCTYHFAIVSHDQEGG